MAAELRHTHNLLLHVCKGLVWIKLPEITKWMCLSCLPVPGALPCAGSSASQTLLCKVLVLAQREQQRSVPRVILLLFFSPLFLSATCRPTECVVLKLK